MKAVFVIGGVSAGAQREGELISDSDLSLLEKAAERANLEASLLLAVTDPLYHGRTQIPMSAVRAERPRLLAEIEAAKPDIVIAFGKLAIQALWNKGSGMRVADLRRQGHELSGIPAPVWVTYSLDEAAVRQGLLRWIALDVQSIAAGKTMTEMGTYFVQRDIHPELAAWLPENPAGIVSIDSETYPAFNPWHPNARIRMIIVSHRTGWAQVVPAAADGAFPEWLVRLIEDPAITKVGSNSKYDYKWFRRFGIEMQNFRCTAVLEHVLDENSPSKDLKTLTLIYHPTLGDYSAAMRDLARERGGMEHLRDEEMYDYAGGDGDAGITIYPKQIEILKRRGLERPYNILMETYPMLADMEYNGARIDMGVNAQLDEAFRTEIAQLRRDIADELGPINPRSKPQLVKALKSKVPDINLFLKNSDEDETTERQVLQREAEKHPVIGKILQFRKRTKLYDTYVVGLRDHLTEQQNMQFVRSDYRMDVVQTYRLSSRNPNLQNIPRNNDDSPLLNIKNQYISRFDGGLIMEADLSQAELREGTMLSGDDAMAQAFAAGTDIHREIAAMLLNKDSVTITAGERQTCKTLDFLIYYGGGAASAANIIVTENDLRGMTLAGGDFTHAPGAPAFCIVVDNNI